MYKLIICEPSERQFSMSPWTTIISLEFDTKTEVKIAEELIKKGNKTEIYSEYYIMHDGSWLRLYDLEEGE